MLNTNLHSSAAVVYVHDVARIHVSANSTIGDDGRPLYWQQLTFYGPEEEKIGTITVFLDRPDVALPVGDQPPYWGLNPARGIPPALDGESPF